MLSPTLFEDAHHQTASTESTESTVIQSLSETLRAAHLLDFYQLPVLKPAAAQLAGQGVVFTDAIALTPSNPRFAMHPEQVVLMPMGTKQSFQIELQAEQAQMQVQGRSTRPISVRAWAADGTLIASHVAAIEPSATTLLPAQIVRISTAGAARVEVSSKAPFTIEGIAL
ncbi:MAG: hypothetical protein F6J97_00270 [Leptolyngbya sp. SIO4C1]|nr:hypothetical protein [Leptolyngbya sp. SIO4C1]